MGTCSYLISSKSVLIPGDSVAFLHEVIFFFDLANQRKDSRGELKKTRKSQKDEKIASCDVFARKQYSINFYGGLIEGISKIFIANKHDFVGGTVASWLARSTPERGVRVRTLARDLVLCSWARHFTLTVPLSTQVYK